MQMIESTIWAPKTSVNAGGRLDDRHENGVKTEPVAERCCQGGHDRVVAAFDAVHAALAGRLVFCKLIDERQQRKLSWIGEKKSTHGRRRGSHRIRRSDAVEPVRDRLAPEHGSNGTVPATLGQTIAANFRFEPALARIPSAGCV